MRAQVDFHRLVWIQHPVGEGWDDSSDPVVWIAVDRLDSAWRGSNTYVGPRGVGSDQAGKYDRVGVFLAQAVGMRPIFVPTVSLCRGEVVFTDGRHRFAWLRDQGLQALPVEVAPERLKTFCAYFETVERVGQFDPASR